MGDQFLITKLDLKHAANSCKGSKLFFTVVMRMYCVNHINCFVCIEYI